MEQTLPKRVARVESLVEVVRSSPDSSFRDAAMEIVQTLMEFHYTGLDRLMEIVSRAEHGEDVMTGFAEDYAVSNMLLLHNLHPIDLESRVIGALESVRPYLHSHGGNVELVGITNGIVRLKMEGNCNGCPASALTIKSAIEKAIQDAAPDVVSIEAA